MTADEIERDITIIDDGFTFESDEDRTLVKHAVIRLLRDLAARVRGLELAAEREADYRREQAER